LKDASLTVLLVSHSPLSCSPQDVTDSTLLRFLRVRAMSVPEASKLYLDDVRWRKEYLPVNMEDVKTELRSGKALVASKPGRGRG